jgi:hypothetical protein
MRTICEGVPSAQRSPLHSAICAVTGPVPPLSAAARIGGTGRGRRGGCGAGCWCDVVLLLLLETSCADRARGGGLTEESRTIELHVYDVVLVRAGPTTDDR